MTARKKTDGGECDARRKWKSRRRKAEEKEDRCGGRSDPPVPTLVALISSISMALAAEKGKKSGRKRNKLHQEDGGRQEVRGGRVAAFDVASHELADKKQEKCIFFFEKIRLF